MKEYTVDVLIPVYKPGPELPELEILPGMGIKAFFCSIICTAYDRKTYVELGGDFPDQ